MPTPRLPDDMKARIRELRKRNFSHREIVKELGVAKGSVYNVLNEPTPHNHTERPTITALAEEPPDGAELWDDAKVKTADACKRARLRRIVDIRVPDDQPVGISVVSDQHIRESGPVDLERAEVDARLIARVPGLYAVLGGDGVDNAIKHRATMKHGGSAAKNEWPMYEHYLRMFRVQPDRGESFSKVLAMISGNHDDFSRDETGVDEVAALAARGSVLYSPDVVLIRFHVGDQMYIVRVRHQGKYSSMYNDIHSVHRMYDMEEDEFDVGVVCHQHRPAIGTFHRHGRIIWGARPGSYQITSAYARRYGFPLTFPTAPTFIFHPDRFEVEGFLDVRSAARQLVALREFDVDARLAEIIG